jgi:CheY-like chemotaxis protein
VLIVDDHDDFRRSARAMLEAEGLGFLGKSQLSGAALTRLLRSA